MKPNSLFIRDINKHFTAIIIIHWEKNEYQERFYILEKANILNLRIISVRDIESIEIGNNHVHNNAHSLSYKSLRCHRPRYTTGTFRKWKTCIASN